MKNEKYIASEEGLEEDIMYEAENKIHDLISKQRTLKRVVIVACVVILVSVGTLMLFNRTDDIEPVITITYNKAYYEPVSEPKKYGLPKKIKENMIGNFLCNVDIDGEVEPNESKTDKLGKLYDYNEIDCDAVKILRYNNDNYVFVLFSNYLYGNYAELGGSTDGKDMYTLFGIESASDIKELNYTKWNFGRTLKTVTDKTVIGNFYKCYYVLAGVSNDKFQDNIFNGKSEEEQQKLSTNLADEMKEIHVKLNSGLDITMCYYPSIGYLEHNLCYYKIDSNLSNLIEINLLENPEDTTKEPKSTEQATTKKETTTLTPTGIDYNNLFDKMMKSPAESSNPYAYIQMHRDIYNELVNGSEETLDYCFAEFEKGGKTGLKGHLMMYVCRQILGSEDIALLTENGQQWYDAYKDAML